MKSHEIARLKYKPNEIKILFVAEAPPENTKRFFYYENTDEHDALFLNLARLLYPELQVINGTPTKKLRQNKEQVLNQMKEDGYYLIDALTDPIELSHKNRQRVKLINKQKTKLLNQISSLIGENPDAKIVLIKSTVYDAVYSDLKNKNLPVINTSKIPFPSSYHVAKFADKLHEILSKNDEAYRMRTKFVWYDGDIEITKSR